MMVSILSQYCINVTDLDRVIEFWEGIRWHADTEQDGHSYANEWGDEDCRNIGSFPGH